MVMIGQAISMSSSTCNTSTSFLRRRPVIAGCIIFVLAFYINGLLGEEAKTTAQVSLGSSSLEKDAMHIKSAEEQSTSTTTELVQTESGDESSTINSNDPEEDTSESSDESSADESSADESKEEPQSVDEEEPEEETSELSDESSATESKEEPEEETAKNTGIFSKHQLLKCDQEDANRWSNKPHKKSNVQSLFNCDLPDAPCTYYYPANFFDKDCGLGKQFAHHIDDAKAKQANGTLWNNMPSVGFPTVTMKNMCLDAKSGDRIRPESEKIKSEIVLTDIGEHNEDGLHCMTERLSFLHVHKAGGSSLHSAFNYIAPNKHANLVRHKFFTPNSEPGVVRTSPRDEKMKNLTLEALAEATKYPDEEFTPNQHVIFAAVRDPTERFISSIGQALGAVGSGGNHIGPILKKTCVHSTSKDALGCLAKYVHDHGYWIELHFTPQVVDIAFTTMWQDVPVSIFPMKPHLTTILGYFGRGNVKARDGSAKDYRSDPILTNMTVADYDEESLRYVCNIYEMDVRMQRSLGMEVPRCDPFIPHEYDFEK